MANGWHSHIEVDSEALLLGDEQAAFLLELPPQFAYEDVRPALPHENLGFHMTSANLRPFMVQWLTIRGLSSC